MRKKRNFLKEQGKGTEQIHMIKKKIREMILGCQAEGGGGLWFGEVGEGTNEKEYIDTNI